MRVELIKQSFDGNTGYKHKHMNFCCDKLKDNPLIKLIDERYYDDGDSDRKPRMCLVYDREWTEYGEEMQSTTYYPIKLCPFCGESINIKIVAEEDMTDKYKKMKRERDILWEGAKATDSKSKEQYLCEKVRELDKKINYLYDTGEYREGYLDD